LNAAIMSAGSAAVMESDAEPAAFAAGENE
jgi:hypothetical protein